MDCTRDYLPIPASSSEPTLWQATAARWRKLTARFAPAQPQPGRRNLLPRCGLMIRLAAEAENQRALALRLPLGLDMDKARLTARMLENAAEFLELRADRPDAAKGRLYSARMYRRLLREAGHV